MDGHCMPVMCGKKWTKKDLKDEFSVLFVLLVNYPSKDSRHAWSLFGSNVS